MHRLRVIVLEAVKVVVPHPDAVGVGRKSMKVKFGRVSVITSATFSLVLSSKTNVITTRVGGRVTI